MTVDYQNALPLDFQPAPEKKTFRATHFSHSKIDGGVLRGSLRGSSPEASDAHRVHLGSGAPAGNHVVRHGHIAHPNLKSRAFSSGVTGDKAIADLSGGERDVWSAAFKPAYQAAVASGAAPDIAKNLAMNQAEHALLAAGYDGMEDSQHSPGNVLLWGDTPTDVST